MELIVSSNLTIWSLVASPVWMVMFPVPGLVILLLLPQLASSNTRATLVKMSRKVRFIRPPIIQDVCGKSGRSKSGNQGYYALRSTDVKGLSHFMSFGHDRTY